MDTTLATTGRTAIAAAPRPVAACASDVRGSWHTNPAIHSAHDDAAAMDVFGTYKPTRRPKESSP